MEFADSELDEPFSVVQALRPLTPDEEDLPSASACALEIQHQALTHCVAFPFHAKKAVGRLNVAAQLNQQRLNGQFCDCSLIVRFVPQPMSLEQPKTLVFPAHKAVLCAACDYFEVLIRDHSMPNDSEFTITVETRDEVDAFAAMLEYMYTGCTILCEEHVIGLLLLADRMRLARLLCGCLRYLTHFLRFDNVLPVWRALYKLSSLHAARTGTALQVSIHPRAKTARQRRRETLAKQRLERLQHIRDAKMRHLALKEEALKYQREMADAAQEEQQRQQQEQIDRFRSLVQMERRRKLLEDARKRQNEVGAKQRKIEEEMWRQRMEQEELANKASWTNNPLAVSAAVASDIHHVNGHPSSALSPRVLSSSAMATPRSARGNSNSNQARALLVAQQLMAAKEKEKQKERESKVEKERQELERLAKEKEERDAAEAAAVQAQLLQSNNPRARLLAKARQAAAVTAQAVQDMDNKILAHERSTGKLITSSSSQNIINNNSSSNINTSNALDVVTVSSPEKPAAEQAPVLPPASSEGDLNDSLSRSSSLSSLYSVHSEAPPPPLVLVRFVPLRSLLLQLDRACVSMLTNHILDVMEVVDAIVLDQQEQLEKQMYRDELHVGADDLHSDALSVRGSEFGHAAPSQHVSLSQSNLSLSGRGSHLSQQYMFRTEAHASAVTAYHAGLAGRFACLPHWLSADQMSILLQQPSLQVESEDQVLEIVAEYALALNPSLPPSSPSVGSFTQPPSPSNGYPLHPHGHHHHQPVPPSQQLQTSPHAQLMVISHLKSLILKSALTLNAASTLLQPRFVSVAPLFLDVLQGNVSSSMASLSGPGSLSRANSVRSVGMNASRQNLLSPTGANKLCRQPSSSSSTSSGILHQQQLQQQQQLLQQQQEQQQQPQSLLQMAAQHSSDSVSKDQPSSLSAAQSRPQRRVYVGLPQLDWSSLQLNQHIQVYSELHPNSAAGVSALAQLNASLLAVGFFAESPASVSSLVHPPELNRQLVSNATSPASESNLALVDLRLQKGAGMSITGAAMGLAGNTTTTVLLPGAPHLINVLTVWKHLVIGGDASGLLHVWAQTDARRPDAWVRQSVVQMESGLSALSVWQDRLLCAQIDRPAHIRSLPDVENVLQTLRVNEAALPIQQQTSAASPANPEEDALACSQTWFFPTIDVAGHAGFVTAQTALTVWMRDPHFSRQTRPNYRPQQHQAKASMGDHHDDGDELAASSAADFRQGDALLAATIDAGASLVVVTDPDAADAEDEEQNGFSAVRISPGETRMWLAPGPVEGPLRCIPVACLSPLDQAPVFGLAVGSDQSYIYCGLEMTGQVLEVKLELYPHAHLVRTQRINVFDVGCTVSRLLLLDDVMIAGSSSAPSVQLQLPAPSAEDGAHMFAPADASSSRLKILKRQPPHYPGDEEDAELEALLSSGLDLSAGGINSAVQSPSHHLQQSPLKKHVDPDELAGDSAVNPFDSKPWTVNDHHAVSPSAASSSAAHFHPDPSQPQPQLDAEDDLIDAQDDPDLYPLPARMRQYADEPPFAPAQALLLEELEPKSWDTLHCLDVREPVFDFALLDHALVVGGSAGDILVFSSVE